MLEAILIVWLVCAVIGSVVAARGRGGAGFALGLFLGPLGVLLALFLRPSEAAVERAALSAGAAKPCPSCAETVKLAALVCRHCGHSFDASETQTAIIAKEAADVKRLGFIFVLVVFVLIAIGNS